MADFAQSSDVTGVMGALTPDQTAALAGLLAEASTKLRAWGAERGIDVDAHIAGNELRIELAKIAVVNAVKRALGLIDGFTEITVAIDDYRETKRRRATAAADPDVYIDARDLTGFLPGKRSRFGTLRMRSAL